MRIYYSTPDELMLLDSPGGMNRLHRRLESFLASEDEILRLKADHEGSPEPHDELLKGIEVKKSGGPVLLAMTDTGWLQLSGSPENLRRYVSHFHFDRDGDHHRPEGPQRGYVSALSLSILLEASSEAMRELHARHH